MKYLIPPRLSGKQWTNLFRRIRINLATGCWDWTGGSYGRYGVVSLNYRLYAPHRLMYALTYGKIPKGRGHGIPVIDHFCKNTLCCNPLHLRLVSQKENNLAGNSLSAQRARQTHCKRGHLLPAPIDGHRTCTICAKMWRDKYAREHRAEHAAYERKRRARLRRLRH